MDIFIDNKAEEYIKSKTEDNSIQVFISTIKGGWCVSHQPSVKMGKPLNEKSFNLHKIGDINIYILNGVKVHDKGLKISLSKFLWTKNLNIDGLII